MKFIQQNIKEENSMALNPEIFQINDAKECSSRVKNSYS